MRNDPVFDPIFNAAPPQDDTAATPVRGQLFDGWSYAPLDKERDAPQPAAAGQRGRGLPTP